MFVSVVVAGDFSGAHINPAVTMGLAVADLFPWAKVVPFVCAQLLGGGLGAFLVWLFYRDHFAATQDADTILGIFATGPAIRRTSSNLLSEIIGTFVLVFTILFISGPEVSARGAELKVGLGSIGALPVAFLVVSIGMSLGGTTGYAINPARDLPPRIIHALLPIRHKGTSDWSYGWIPVVGPVLGGTLAALTYNLGPLVAGPA